MGKKAKIRVIALALIQDHDRIFLSVGHDATAGRNFYRALGGGVDFGETSAAALEREFAEELNATLCNIQYLGCVESLFTYDGKPGHEIIQLYRADFTDPHFYQQAVIPFQENGVTKEARWVHLSELQQDPDLLVPAQCWPYLEHIELLSPMAAPGPE
jgi:8-oxo-dGTP pyrophosphatase MutT (NUDIX family)